MPNRKKTAAAASRQADRPIDAAELGSLFASFSGFSHIALAVSGGPDSLALMHLSAEWRSSLGTGGPGLTVLTLDHGLRPAAAEETRAVAGAAAALGLDCRVLTRTRPDRQTAVQEQARADRYRLLCGAARAIGAGAIATGHTADDQAETLLMRLARGSGVDGLSAMTPVGRVEDLVLLRPLLAVSKARLVATLQQRQITWIEDPSNRDLAYERPRLRAILSMLAAAGLTTEALGLSAARLARARASLEATCLEAERHLVHCHPAGFATIDRTGFDALSEEIRLRLLGRWLARLGGSGQPQRLARLERLVSRLSSEREGRHSLAGCSLEASRGALTITREPGRNGLPRLQLQPGETQIWDRRFRVSLSPSALDAALIRAPIAADLRGELAQQARTSGLPRAALMAAPAAWRGAALIAMPALGISQEAVSFELVLLDPANSADSTELPGEPPEEN